MPKTNPQLAGLTAEEIEIFQYLINRLEDINDQEDLIKIRDALARSRASEDRKWKLLEKHEWVDQLTSSGSVVNACLECGAVKETYQSKHKPDCAWDAELAGTGE